MIIIDSIPVKYNAGSSILDYITEKPLPLCVSANNSICDLHYIPSKGEEIELMYLTNTYAFACFRNTLFLIFATAVYSLLADVTVTIRRSVEKATYCDVETKVDINELLSTQITTRMKELIDAKAEIIKTSVPPSEVGAEHIPRDTINTYSICDNKSFHISGIVATSTSVIENFLITPYDNGFILQYPNYRTNGQIPTPLNISRLSASNRQNCMWNDVLNISSVADLNYLVQQQNTRDMLLMQDGLHEKNISQIADVIAANSENNKVVLITGPSSSGKTTFSRKLGVHLRVNKLTPVEISLDDYFIDIEHSLRHEDGSFNFEELESIDYKLFNEHLAALVHGEEVEIPKFSFGVAKRLPTGRKMQLKEGQVLVVEGIHALNERLTPSVKDNNKFKIYCSPLSNLNISDITYLSPTDLRLIRRLVRDYNFRYSSAQNTFDMWPSVKKGEEKNIFPYEKDADMTFNSSIIYEICVFKRYAEPLLRSIPLSSDKYPMAQRLLETTSYFQPMDDYKVPSTSILREFIGGSAYF